MAKNRRVKLVNYKKLYAESPNPVDLNDLYLENPDVNVLDQIFAKSEGNIDYAPSCECGAYKGRIYEHHVCPFCLTPVESDFTSNFKPKNWVRIPEDMPPILHPRLYILLCSLGGRMRTKKKSGKQVQKQNVKIIDYILDPDEILPDDLSIGIHGQGFTYFAEHMDEIMRFLLLEHPKFSRMPKALALWEIYQHELEEDNLLIRRFPLLNPTFHPMHVRGRLKTMDKIADVIMPVVVDMFHSSYANKHLVTGPHHADRALWEIYTQYIRYIRLIMEFRIGDKHALVRRHNVAARLHFTGRTVISPIVGRHMGDEIHLPWNIGMMILQPEIINLLCNRKGYSPADAINYFYKHINVHSDLLEWCFKTLIDECPSKGIPCIMNRNPTLIRESERLMYIVYVSPDVNDKTLKLPPLVCKGFNARRLAA